jgi:hypothetical protein
MQIRARMSMSADGYVTTPGGWPAMTADPAFVSGRSHGIAEFLKGCEAALMGRATFEPALTNDRWLGGDRLRRGRRRGRTAGPRHGLGPGLAATDLGAPAGAYSTSTESRWAALLPMPCTFQCGSSGWVSPAASVARQRSSWRPGVASQRSDQPRQA